MKCKAHTLPTMPVGAYAAVQAVLHHPGISQGALAHLFGASPRSVRRWIADARTLGVDVTFDNGYVVRGIDDLAESAKDAGKWRKCARCHQVNRVKTGKWCARCKQLSRADRAWHGRARLMCKQGKGPVAIAQALKAPLWDVLNDEGLSKPGVVTVLLAAKLIPPEWHEKQRRARTGDYET